MTLAIRKCEGNGEAKYEVYSFEFPDIESGYGKTKDEALLDYRKVFRTYFERMKLYMNILESDTVLLVDVDNNGNIENNDHNAKIKEIIEKSEINITPRKKMGKLINLQDSIKFAKDITGVPEQLKRFISISYFERKPEKVLQNISTENYLFLIRNDKITAVLSSPEFFNRLIDNIEDLKDIVEILKSKINPTDGVPAEEFFNSLGIKI
jgi:hypothetical protein